MWIGPLVRAVEHRAQGLRRHGPQRMRSHADDGIGKSSDGVPRLLDEAQEAIGIVEETPLPRIGRCGAEPAIGVEGRQQRQPDAGLGRRRGDAGRHLAERREGTTVAVVMQVVELGDGREAAFEHLDEGVGGDRSRRRQASARRGTDT